ncbi:MAG: DUF308 domain-containing protein [Alphaproteobacteria bacterium]|nr:DUF308 domain-containing protein [Alphaproteobacteria bacterium]
MPFTKTGMTTEGFEALGARIRQELQAHRGKYILQGTLFVIAGILAGAFPAATALNVELIVGAALLLTGAFQLILTLRAKMHWWSLASACLSIVMGVIMLWQPLPILLAFVTLLAIFMTAEGFMELMLAIQFHPARGWGWMLFSGIVTLALAAILWIGFPTLDVLYLGCMISINLVFYGLSLLMLVWKAAP